MTGKTANPLRIVRASQATDDLNHANLLLSRIRAIADLVEFSNHEMLFDSTIGNAMAAICADVDKIEDLLSPAFKELNAAGSAMEVAHG